MLKSVLSRSVEDSFKKVLDTDPAAGDVTSKINSVHLLSDGYLCVKFGQDVLEL